MYNREKNELVFLCRTLCRINLIMEAFVPLCSIRIFAMLIGWGKVKGKRNINCSRIVLCVDYIYC